MNHLTTSLFCLSLLLALPAQAQQREYKPGLNYTTLAQPRPPVVQDASPAIESTANAPTDEPAPVTRIWNKYKDLATGTAGEKQAAEKQANARSPQKPDLPVKPAMQNLTPATQQAETAKPSAFQSIIEGWKENKETRSDMRSMSFKTPDLPAKQADPAP